MLGNFEDQLAKTAESQPEAISLGPDVPIPDDLASEPDSTITTAGSPNAPGFSMAGLAANTFGLARAGLINTLITAIRQISAERDRDEVLRWFMSAREILKSGASRKEISLALYRSIDTLRVGQLITNMFVTTIRSYQTSQLPLALKVAIPVTALGMATLGAKGVGIAGFGTAIGLPVVVLLFLGAAGVTSILEAFIRDRNVRDPLTRLLLTFVAFESARKAKKELLAALKADAMVPRRAEVPPESNELLQTLLQMDPIDFERHVMSFFEVDGYPTGMTPRSNDFGVDGYVMHPDGVIIVQCKRYATDNPVGRPAVQQFKGIIEEQKAFRGFLVTTSRFTAEAVASAEQSARITLVDGHKLLEWHREGRVSG